MKRVLWTLGMSAVIASGAIAQMNELMRRDGFTETEAASVIAISRGLGLRMDYVARTSRDIRAKVWELAPAFYISERTGIDPRSAWQDHRRGASWAEIERDADGYGWGRGRCGREPWQGPDRYEPRYRRSGLIDILDDILHGSERYRYGSGDRDFEERLWDQLLERAFNQDASRLWRYLDRGTHLGDLALACQMSRVARVRPERIMDELLRTHNWNRVRERFGVARDWESRERGWNRDR